MIKLKTILLLNLNMMLVKTKDLSGYQLGRTIKRQSLDQAKNYNAYHVAQVFGIVYIIQYEDILSQQ